MTATNNHTSYPHSMHAGTPSTTIKRTDQLARINSSTPRDGIWNTKDQASTPNSIQRPIIMTGHQAAFFHPGILAKYHAAQHLSRALQGSYATITVDHNTNQSTPLLRIPTTTHNFITAEQTIEPTHHLAPKHLHTHLNEQDTSPQAAAAANANALGITAPLNQATSTILNTDAGRAFINSMLNNPTDCAAAYNNALKQHPTVDIHKLRISNDPAETQLPIWISTTNTTATTRTLTQATKSNTPIAPKALPLTALLRLHACDLFIHGTGGANYDNAMETWITNWLGTQAHQSLAPRITVTADLPLSASPTPITPAIARKLAWRAHHAKHTPKELNDNKAQEQKDTLINEIKHASTPTQRARHFQSLQLLLERYRYNYQEKLRELSTTANAANAALHYAQLHIARSWPAVIYPDTALSELRTTVQTTLNAALDKL